jgi:hypothetical protein
MEPENVTGSLTLGGYDQSRINPNGNSIEFAADSQNGSLQVQLYSIGANGALPGASATLLPQESAINVTLDSSTSQLWLPESVCESFAAAFGLYYNETWQLYQQNQTVRAQLLASSPSITFQLGDGTNPKAIKLPYAAFDLELGLPYVGVNQTTIPYFPLRRANNSNQYALGRAFLQEAYVTVDWERGKFYHQPSSASRQYNRYRCNITAIKCVDVAGVRQHPYCYSTKGSACGIRCCHRHRIRVDLGIGNRRDISMAPEAEEADGTTQDLSPSIHHRHT